MIKKKIALFIALMLAAAIFVACADPEDETPAAPDAGIETEENGGDPGMQQDDENAEDEAAAALLALLTPDLPDISFDGYEFRILSVHQDTTPWLLTQILAEEMTGEPFNDAVFQRNSIIEERFDIVMTETLLDGRNLVRDRARTSIRAGSDDFDLYMIGRDYIFDVAQEGLLVDYNQIPFIDLTRPYWDQSMIRDLSIGGRLFTMSGDLNFTTYSATTVLFFNRALHTDHALDCPYEMVRQGRWTLNAFHEQARQATRDLDGNGVFDENDQFGVMSLDFVLYPAFIGGTGVRFLDKDADDLPIIAADSPRFIEAFHSLIDIMHDGDIFFDANADGRDHRLQDVMFPNNQALFWSELMNWAGILRGMDNDFGILPNPKLNEYQTQHYSVVFGPFFMGVPVTTVDDALDRTGIILEALSAESRRVVMPVYYDVVLTTMLVRDDESGEMLDIIFDNRLYDLGQQLFLSLIVTPIYQMASRGDGDVSGLIEARRGAIDTQLQRTIDRFMDID